MTLCMLRKSNSKHHGLRQKAAGENAIDLRLESLFCPDLDSAVFTGTYHDPMMWQCLKRGVGHWGGALLFGLLLAPIAPIAQASSSWVGLVEYVVDGDTLHVRTIRSGELIKIRVLGIDAPEICQSWGPQARLALLDRVSGQRVTIKGATNDDYQRLLATVWLDGQDVGAWMVKQGHAWSYRWRDQSGLYDGLEGAARRQGRGLFSQADTESPHQFRRRHGSCYPNQQG